MTEGRPTPGDISSRLQKMEAVQMDHFRRGMFLLVYFTVAFACLAWEWIKHFKLVFELLPLATVVVICVWVACVSKHARDLSRLRRLAESDPTAIAEATVEKLDEHVPVTGA